MKDLFIELNGSPCIVTVSDDYGEAMVNGRKWRWEWHHYCGPMFVNKDGNARRRLPGEKHAVWKAISRWEKRQKAKGVRL